VIRHPAATTTIAIEINRRSSSIDDALSIDVRARNHAGYSARGAATRHTNKKNYERHRRRRRQGHAFSTTVCDDDDDVDAPSSATASPTVVGPAATIRIVGCPIRTVTSI